MKSTRCIANFKGTFLFNFQLNKLINKHINIFCYAKFAKFLYSSIFIWHTTSIPTSQRNMLKFWRKLYYLLTNMLKFTTYAFYMYGLALQVL